MGTGSEMSIMIAGGGTGGHLFPGIAMAELFQKNTGTDKITFVGTDHGLEAAVIPREGFGLEFIRAEGLVGKSLFEKVRAVYYLILSLFDSFQLISRYRPDIIIGSGGYASFATVMAGYLRSVPTLILEQNSMPGLANRILGKFATVNCVTYQESISYFPKGKTHLTGNPVREKVLRGSRTSALKLFGLDKSKFTVFIFGGSLGASSINKAVVESLQYLLDIRADIQFLHQTGEKDYEYVRNAYRSFGYKGMISPFIYQMAEAYAVSDIIISRAGATTLAEITSIGKASILVPYPYAAANHQELNARKLQQMKAAFMVLDRDLNGRKLAALVKELYTSEQLRTEIQQNCRSLGQPQAANKIYGLAVSIAGRGKRNV
ncbi:MAG: undecaprenyldiphospho-muramoylpentapeptide beta-N-acetylglucosaminyltransferase [Nitrospirota bacterium]|nr:MAG: undecaprenyldiphospho-muramoylpentapeptide beta-N-acetylglucosaminyltransferase [Nitrospirota bacterium]